MAERAKDGTATFATMAIAVAAVALVLAVVGALGASSGDANDDRADTVLDGDGDGDRGDDGGDDEGGGDGEGDDGAVADADAEVADVVRSSAAAMAAVTSVEFRVRCDGAPVHVDQFGRIALTSLRGQFAVPSRAQAELSVTIDGDLKTRLGAVAVGEEIWLSNPVTGDFETLPEGYDIDPSRFFDPKGGWQPLLAGLAQVALVGIENRGGDRYHVRGTASAERMSDVTAGLVDDDGVVVDLWVHPTSFVVTATEFDTTTPDGVVNWQIELGRYGDTFRIEPPDNVRAAGTPSGPPAT